MNKSKYRCTSIENFIKKGPVTDLLKSFFLLSLLLISSCKESMINIRFDGSGDQALSMSYFAESAADGSGVRYEQLELDINDSATLYAIKRDSNGNYIENIAVSWSKDGGIGSLLIVGDGEAAEFSSPSVGTAKISILDNGKIVKVIDVTVSYPPTSSIDIETLVISSISEEGFSASLAYTGDFEDNSTQTLYYCNQSSGACDPEVDGGSIVMTRGASEYTAVVSGLTSPTDDFAVRMISADADGVVGSATQDTVVTLLDVAIDIETLAISAISYEGFSASLAYTGDYDASSTQTLYYCNQTYGACNPEIDGGSIVMTRGASEYTAVVSGLSAPTDDFAVRLISEDAVGVVGSATQNTVVTLQGAPISISSFSFVGPNKDGGIVRIVSSGDEEQSASVALFYCNLTSSPSCNPESGVEVAMSKTASGYEATLSGLSATMNEGDELAFRVIATDLDGTSGSPINGTDYLADLRLSDLSVSQEKATSFFASVSVANDSNTDGSATLYHCNETSANGCDPLAGTAVTMTRDGSNFTLDVTSLDGAGYTPNDLVNVRVVGADPDGAKNFDGSLSATLRLADMQMQEFIITEIKRDSFYIYAPAMKSTIVASATVQAYLCDATVNPGCDPVTFGGSAYNMTYSNWPHRYKDKIDGFTGVPGNMMNVAVEYYSPEGVYVDGNEDDTTVVLNQSYKVPVATNIYRSVGPGQNYALVQGSYGINLSISTSTANFSSSLGSDIGVGDVLFYDGTSDGNYESVAFIKERFSNVSFSLQQEYGGDVSDFSSSTAWVLYRAYTSANDAITADHNSAILADSRITSAFDNWPTGKKDISARTGLDISFNIALYAGDSLDTEAVNIDESDWKKDRDNKIRLFVPNKLSHVGLSQRHEGAWDESKYVLAVTDSNSIRIDLDNILVEGLQIDVRGSLDGLRAIHERNNMEGMISNNIIRNSSTGEGLKGIVRYEYANRGNFKFSHYVNNIIYNFNTPGSYGFIVDWQSQDGGYLLNNTFYNNWIGIRPNSYRSLRVENNISVDNVSLDYYYSSNSYKTLYNNIDSDDTISQATPSSSSGNIANSSASSLFVDAPNGDFRLLPGAAAIDSGRDLSSSYTIDITSSSRDANFDIGAHEY